MDEAEDVARLSSALWRGDGSFLSRSSLQGEHAVIDSRYQWIYTTYMSSDRFTIHKFTMLLIAFSTVGYLGFVPLLLFAFYWGEGIPQSASQVHIC